MSVAAQAARALAAIVVSCALGSAWADESPNMVPVGEAGQSGAEIYSQICQGCHMPQGQGATGAGHYPRLANDDTLKGRLGELVAASVVLTGRNGMPAFGTPTGASAPERIMPELSDAQVAAIVNYVRSHFGNNYKEQLSAAQVATLRHPASTPGF